MWQEIIVVAMCVVSLAGQPTYFRSTDRFQYRHAEEWSGDLGPLHVKPLERNNWFESREKTRPL